MEGSNPTEESRQTLFLKDFVDIARPFETIRSRFTGEGEWLTPLASAAQNDGETLRLRIGPSLAAGRMTREVEVRLAKPRDWGSSLVISISWKATTLPSLYPELDGDLELAPLGLEACRLTLTASYKPPLGQVGRGLDIALFHHVAESTVRAFLHRVATSLESNGDKPEASA